MSTNKIKRWEIAALIALCVTLCHGVVEARRLDALSENIIRLHVIAVSDEAAEQAVKLRVRDAVAEALSPLLASCADTAEAAEAIEAHLSDIEAAALSAAEGRDVAVDFGTLAYPLREGDGYALPAGEYASLRVTLGDGDGHNWWGVLFPELTTDSTEAYEDAAKILGEDTVRLITEDGGVTVRFRVLELWAKLKTLFGSYA